jgi:hypothetical protein
MDALKKKADELKIEYTEDTEKETLEILITEREEELSKDADYLKEQLNFQKAEAKKAFIKRDTALADKRRLSQKIKELEDKEGVSTGDYDSLKSELEALKKFREEAEAAADLKAQEGLNQTERDKLQLEKEFRKLQDDFASFKNTSSQEREDSNKILEDANKRISSLRTHGLEADIIKSAHKNNAWNADQIVNLTKGFFTYDEQLDKYTRLERDEQGKIIDELSVSDYITSFLGKEENENLIKADVKDSFETKKGESDAKIKLAKKTIGAGIYDPKDEKIMDEAEERGLEVKDWIEIKTMEFEKQKEIRAR